MPSANFKFELKGSKELERALLQLPKSTGKAALRRALTQVSVPIAVDAARRAPRSSEAPHLADSIAVSTKLKRSQRRRARPGVTVYVGARMPHAHLVEFGTGPRYTDGKYAGQMPAQPFLRPAWDAHKGRIMSELGDILWAEILRAARNLARRAERYRAKATAMGKRL